MHKYRILIHKLWLINKIIKSSDVASLLKKNLICLRFQKIISIDDLINIDYAIEYVFEYVSRVTSFHHIEFNGLPHYETETEWKLHNIKERPSYDVDIPCNGNQICGRKPMIYAKNHDKIKYILEFDYSEKNILSIDDSKYNNFVSHIASYKLRNILLVGFNKLIVKYDNDSRTKDHRGLDHCKVYLPIYNNVCMRKYATLYDLATAYYKLKSHKWDNKYEQFCYAETKTHEKDVKVFIGFYHGQ
jgi:hypothetical protein